MRTGAGVKQALALGGLLMVACGDDGAPPLGTDTDFTTGGTTLPPPTASTTESSTMTVSTTTTSTTSTSTATGVDTGSSSSSGSSGCPLGTAGCPCDLDETPACQEGVCIENVCVVLCEDEPDEPNNMPPDEVVDLGNLTDDDDDRPLNYDGQLGGNVDVDWLAFNCTDTILNEVEPIVNATTTEGMRICMFMDCVIGGNPLFNCPGGTIEDQAPFGFLQGCCLDVDDETVMIDLTAFNCPDSDDETVDVFFRIDNGSVLECIDYQLEYDC